ncbi:MAG: RNA polymerase sigma factor [Bryobacteraceae bacterium]
MQNRLTRQLSDDALVENCTNGDEAAFDELMKRHHPTAIKVAYSIVRNRQDAEDEVQNAFWKAYKHIGQFNRDSKFSTWLTRIVVNQCLMKLRRSRKFHYLYIGDASTAEDFVNVELRDNRHTPEEDVGEVEVHEVLFEEIRKTPPLLRNVFLLRDVQQIPMPQVAEMLGISVAAAKSRLLRARSELRSRMTRHCSRSGPAALMT